MTNNLPATDPRSRIRIWDDKFQCIAEQRIEPGQRPIDVAAQLLQQTGLTEANCTADWRNGGRWSGRITQDGPRLIDHREFLLKLKWPDNPLFPPSEGMPA